MGTNYFYCPLRSTPVCGKNLSTCYTFATVTQPVFLRIQSFFLVLVITIKQPFAFKWKMRDFFVQVVSDKASLHTVVIFCSDQVSKHFLTLKNSLSQSRGPLSPIMISCLSMRSRENQTSSHFCHTYAHDFSWVSNNFLEITMHHHLKFNSEITTLQHPFQTKGHLSQDSRVLGEHCKKLLFLYPLLVL